MMRANRPFVVDDVEAGALAGRDLSAYRQAEVRALICAPLNKDGHYVARMVVSQKDAAPLGTLGGRCCKRVANRCWESVQAGEGAERSEGE